MPRYTSVPLLLLALAGASLPLQAHEPVAPELRMAPVEVSVESLAGEPLQAIALQPAAAGQQRAYLLALPGQRYRIRLHNRSGARVAAVIAVDGRNIINGARSDLSVEEPKYVLDPYVEQEYSGWRSSLETVQAFYFTRWPQSYAAAFGDDSAPGVIAIAIFEEEHPPAIAPEPEVAQPAAPASESAARRADKAASAGTGWGESRREPARRVHFVAAAMPSQRIFLKYEWRETLCRRGLLDCIDDAVPNRFWPPPAFGFAPPPPR
ncbi:MAG: hypothetical protein R3E77_16175 [Steroidobacteraceae bacterium]